MRAAEQRRRKVSDVDITWSGRVTGDMLLDPNGGHLLRLTVRGWPTHYRLSRQRVRELRHLLDEFEQEAEAADEGPELVRQKWQNLGRGR